MRRQSCKSCYPPSIKLTELGKLCDYCGRDDGADTFYAAKAGSLIVQFIVLVDYNFHLGLGFGLATLQDTNMLQNTAPYPLVLDVSRFDAAPLIAFIAAKETNYGNETDGRIPR